LTVRSIDKYLKGHCVSRPQIIRPRTSLQQVQAANFPIYARIIPAKLSDTTPNLRLAPTNKTDDLTKQKKSKKGKLVDRKSKLNKSRE